MGAADSSEKDFFAPDLLQPMENEVFQIRKVGLAIFWASHVNEKLAEDVGAWKYSVLECASSVVATGMGEWSYCFDVFFRNGVDHDNVHAHAYGLKF